MSLIDLFRNRSTELCELKCYRAVSNTWRNKLQLLSQLTKENEELKLKLLKVKHQRDDAIKELDQIKEFNKVNELLRNYVTTRDIHVQTDPKIGYPPLDRIGKKKDHSQNDPDPKKSSALLSMHSNLMKRYEKEVKQNMTHVETITNLNLGMVELEKKLKEKTEQITVLERDLKMLQIQLKSKNRFKSSHSRSRSPNESSDDLEEISTVKKENRKLRRDLDKLKQELNGLDYGFFEEIEDIKYALQQSAKLNKIYEKTLRKMCMQFGVPYPHPEKKLEGR